MCHYVIRDLYGKRVFMRNLHEEIHLECPNLLEDVGLKFMKDVPEQPHNVLLVPGFHSTVPECQTSESALEETAHDDAVRDEIGVIRDRVLDGA